MDTVLPKPITKDRLYLGIDPGANGGIAAIYPSGMFDLRASMPETELGIWFLISGLKDSNVTAVIEWIHPAIKGIGKSPMSKLYGSYMALRTALTAAQIPFETVQAYKWQQAMGISNRKAGEATNKWKDRLRAKAQQLFPREEIWKETLGKQRAVCDAMLIALYCQRLHEGKLG